ncbi:MAG: esterase family protein [Lachnospiraceae bacterium]|nr:esterase family protein [Lachnospiraceae bacterium]
MNINGAFFQEYAAPGIIEEVAGVDYGILKKHTYYSTTRERETKVNVLLPPGYSENEKYPVLYALHGYWGDEDTIVNMGRVQQMLGNLIAAGEAEKMIVVFPYIYTSKTQETCSGLDSANCRNYDNFVNDLTTDLMPYMEQTFSVKTGRENTAITGFSMGGREALFIGVTRINLFRYIGATCPAPGLTPGIDSNMTHPGQLKERELTIDETTPYFLLLTAGSQDDVVWDHPSKYHDILNHNGVNHVWHTVSTGGHDDTSVQSHLYNYLRAIFKMDLNGG